MSSANPKDHSLPLVHFASRDQLNIIQFNVENLFLFLDVYAGQDLKKMTTQEWKKLSTSITPNKELAKTWGLAHTIQDTKADIVMLNEVGSIDSLKNFNELFLANQFDCFLEEGNSNRGIDVGYLIRKDLKLKSVLISHKNRPIDFLYPHETVTSAGGKSHYFSRDVAELRLFHEESNTLVLVILLTHLKSKLDPDGIDVQGRLRRGAELKMLMQIYKEVETEVGAQTPILVAGDFNGIAAKNSMEDEFKSIYENTDLLDALEVAEKPQEERFTQVQIMHSGKRNYIQIDYILMNKILMPYVDKSQTRVYRFKSDLNIELPIPNNIDERDRLPSDHYPVVLCLKKNPT
jgi:endonuclease/exonuclease/phosphatase family metal-dependent hydrolase